MIRGYSYSQSAALINTWVPQAMIRYIMVPLEYSRFILIICQTVQQIHLHLWNCYHDNFQLHSMHIRLPEVDD